MEREKCPRRQPCASLFIRAFHQSGSAVASRKKYIPQTYQNFSEQQFKHVPGLPVYVLQCRRQPQLQRQTVSGPCRLARHSDVHDAIVPVKTAQLRGNTRTLCRLPQQVSA